MLELGKIQIYCAPVCVLSTSRLLALRQPVLDAVITSNKSYEVQQCMGLFDETDMMWKTKLAECQG